MPRTLLLPGLSLTVCGSRLLLALEFDFLGLLALGIVRLEPQVENGMNGKLLEKEKKHSFPVGTPHWLTHGGADEQADGEHGEDLHGGGERRGVTLARGPAGMSPATRSPRFYTRLPPPLLVHASARPRCSSPLFFLGVFVAARTAAAACCSAPAMTCTRLPARTQSGDISDRFCSLRDDFQVCFFIPPRRRAA